MGEDGKRRFHAIATGEGSARELAIVVERSAIFDGVTSDSYDAVQFFEVFPRNPAELLPSGRRVSTDEPNHEITVFRAQFEQLSSKRQQMCRELQILGEGHARNYGAPFRPSPVSSNRAIAALRSTATISA